MTLHEKVHCHVCPLKDLCDFAQPDATYKWAHMDECFDTLSSKEWTALTQATLSCPLRKVLQSSDKH